MQDNDSALWQHALQDWILNACHLEVLSPKPGNVCPGNEFLDASVEDFLTSAQVAAGPLAQAGEIGVGESVLRAIRATRDSVGHNTNLGIALLIAPLAAVPFGQRLCEGIGAVLNRLTIQDSMAVYEAIRIATPGGLGDADSQDVRQTPSMSLRDCMQLAAHRDRIAAQYANNFQDVLQHGIRFLTEATTLHSSMEMRVTWLAVRLLAEFPDSLIARKCGQEVAEDVSRRARLLLDAGWPQPGTEPLYHAFDASLRSDSHRLNPGATADLVAAILFAGFREKLFI